MKGSSNKLQYNISLEVGQYIKQLKTDYRKHREPIPFSFRTICAQWLKRSDKYTHMIHSYPAKLVPHIPAFFYLIHRIKIRRDSSSIRLPERELF